MFSQPNLLGHESLCPINGYQTIEFNTHDMHLPQPNRNCGGGVGIYIDEHLTYTKQTSPILLYKVSESIWIKVKMNKNEYRVIGNK